MFEYEQVSEEPLRLETHGGSPFGIAKFLTSIGVGGVVLCVVVTPVLPWFGEEAFAAAGIGLGFLGMIAIVGAFRLAMEQASYSLIVTQPRVLEIHRAEHGRARIVADRRMFFVEDARRVELHEFLVGDGERRFAVGIVFGSGIIELQFDGRSSAEWVAGTLCQRLGYEGFATKKRSVVPAAIGLGGCLTVLAVMGAFPLGLWPVLDDGDMGVTVTAASIVLALCGLVYLTVRYRSKPTILQTLQKYYGQPKP